jgi:FAD synthase
MHKFEADFYGSKISMLVAGYLRPEKNFESLGSLVSRSWLMSQMH